MDTTKILIECSDEIGLIAKITGILFEQKLNVMVNDEFVDKENNKFFMRSELASDCDHTLIQENLKKVLPGDANIRIAGPGKKKIIIMASKEPYCLGELLVRCVYGDMNAEILAVISNHNKLGYLTDGFRVPFYHIPHKGKSREEHEAEIFQVLDEFEFDYLILAKYMRILTPGFIQRCHTERIINIHHSFLPAFIGAKPYKQAHERGVKIIGATCHFVNENLDEGPIIVQDVTHVKHNQDAKELAKAGRAVEKAVLTKALNLVFEDRVFISGNRTIIFG